MGIRKTFFFFLHENVCCWYLLEVPRRGASNGYQHYMCLWRNKKNINNYLTLVLLNKLILIFSKSDYLIWIVAIDSNTYRQTVQIQISWLLKKPTDLDLHCLQRQGIDRFSRTRVNQNMPYLQL